MAWLFSILVLSAVTGSWVFIAARHTATKHGDELIRAYGRLLPAFVAAIFLAGCLLASGRDSLVSNLALWVHHAAAWSLFAFLLAGEYLQIEAWWRMRSGKAAGPVAAVYHRIWILTKLIPAPAALTVFLTGLRLMWESPEANSPAELWLLCMVLGFSFFFFDGIFGYTHIISELDSYWRGAVDQKTPLKIAAGYHRPSARVQILMHTVSWPFVFLLGVFRWNPPNPLSGYVAALEHAFNWLPTGWPQIAVALLLWALMGMVVGAVRILSRRDMGLEHRRAWHDAI
jgi:hypothetical protein